MAARLEQTKTTAKTVGSTTSTNVWTGNTSTGNCILFGISTDSGLTTAVTSVTDSQSNTYTKVFGVVTGGGAIATLDLWVAKNITGGTTPTITANLGGAYITGIIAREYSGLDIYNPVDVFLTAASGASSNALAVGPAAMTSYGKSVLVGFGSTGDSGNTYTAGTGYSNVITLKVGTTLDLGMEDRKVLAAEQFRAAMAITNVSDWAMAIIALRAPSTTPYIRPIRPAPFKPGLAR